MSSPDFPPILADYASRGVYSAVYLVGCVLVALFATRKRHSAVLFFAVSLLLTPLVGLLTILLVSPRRR